MASQVLAEMAGHESQLLLYQQSSRLIESIFQSHAPSALAFLLIISALKHQQQLDLLSLQGCSSRTIESLLWSTSPLLVSQSPSLLSLLSHFSSLIIDNWQILTSPGSFGVHFVRAMIRLTAGLERRGDKRTVVPVEMEGKKKKKGGGNQLKEMGKTIVVRALDYQMMKGWSCEGQEKILLMVER
jgi:hypothetical protein